MNKLLELAYNADPIGVAVEELKFAMQYALKAAMKKKNMSQKELAEKIGCSASNVSQMLADGGNPTVETVGRALALLDERFAFASATLNGDDVVDLVKKREKICDVQFQRISDLCVAAAQDAMRAWCQDKVKTEERRSSVEVIRTSHKSLDWHTYRSAQTSRTTYSSIH